MNAARAAAADGAVVDVGPVDGIPLGEGRAFVVGRRTVAVFRPRTGGLFAIDGHCPHRGGPLAEGIVGGETVVCPLHAWKIDLRTGRCQGGTGSVETYSAFEVAGRIVVRIGEPA